MAYTPITLYRKGVVRETTSREEELRLRWEGWSTDLDPNYQVPNPAIPGDTISLDELIAQLSGGGGGVLAVGFQHNQDTPSASWQIPLPTGFSRTPSVTLYVDGEEVDADVEVTGSLVTVVFPTPQVGVAVLT